MIITGEEIQAKNKINPPPLTRRRAIKEIKMSPIRTSIPKNLEMQLKEKADR